MIRFSKMADYGVLLLGHMARPSADGLASASGLATQLHMPQSVVSNLLKSFREHGLLESRRGLHGGYRLARPSAGISLLEILRAIDGPVHLTDCAAFELTGICEYEDVCASRSPLRAVNQRIVEMLAEITLEQIQRCAPLLPAVPATTHD